LIGEVTFPSIQPVVHQVGLQLDLVVHDNGDILRVRTHISVILAVCLSILVKVIREENYLVWIRWVSSGAQKFKHAGRVGYSADMFLKIKTVCLHVVIPEMHSFSMRPAKSLPKNLDPKTVLIYRPHPV
jgi:hypothetical protein